MLDLLWLIPALPFSGFVLLVLVGSRLPRVVVACIGVGTTALAAVAMLAIAAQFIVAPPSGFAFRQTLWTWVNISNFTPQISLYLDALSVIFALIVTFVGLLIHLYSMEYMAEDEGYSRFFAYMNLFVGSMLTLVLADNLLLLYLGWECVGICSYLLIGFWYDNPANGRAAIKAFVITRFGDTAFAVGLFLLFTSLGTLDIQEAMLRAAREWPAGSALVVAAAALLLGGALGKSAQVPLQTWLPDAMAGPTPVSALIHAATMVTAGVYLIARMNVLYSLAPVVQFTVAVIGLVTLLMAGCSALTESDIKRVLAYSTISQIGYMFLALGVGAWSAAVFHFFTHAFFKALLFLAAGAIMICCHHERNMFKMGGLRSQLPLTFWTFLIAAASLSALPLITGGFYSKDKIIFAAWSSGQAGFWLGAGGLAGAFLTSLYTFRMVFLTFFGESKTQATRQPGWKVALPLVILAGFSIVSGLVDLPRYLGHFELFSDFLSTTLPHPAEVDGGAVAELEVSIVSSVTALAGIFVAYVLFLKKPRYGQQLVDNPAGSLLFRLWHAGWGFDWLYDRLIVRPFVWIAVLNRQDVIDPIYHGIAVLNRSLHEVLSRTQTGNLRWYAAAIGLATAIHVALMVLI
jgi:NADH-quinone oxidoreductase subunit L